MKNTVGLVLEGGEGGLKLGFEGRKVGKVVEKGRAVVLKGGERLRQVDFELVGFEERRNWVISRGTHFVERKKEECGEETPSCVFFAKGDPTRKQGIITQRAPLMIQYNRIMFPGILPRLSIIYEKLL